MKESAVARMFGILITMTACIFFFGMSTLASNANESRKLPEDAFVVEGDSVLDFESGLLFGFPYRANISDYEYSSGVILHEDGRIVEVLVPSKTNVEFYGRKASVSGLFGRGQFIGIRVRPKSDAQLNMNEFAVEMSDVFGKLFEKGCSSCTGENYYEATGVRHSAFIRERKPIVSGDMGTLALDIFFRSPELETAMKTYETPATYFVGEFFCSGLLPVSSDAGTAKRVSINGATFGSSHEASVPDNIRSSEDSVWFRSGNSYSKFSATTFNLASPDIPATIDCRVEDERIDVDVVRYDIIAIDDAMTAILGVGASDDVFRLLGAISGKAVSGDSNIASGGFLIRTFSAMRGEDGEPYVSFIAVDADKLGAIRKICNTVSELALQKKKGEFSPSSQEK